MHRSFQNDWSLITLEVFKKISKEQDKRLIYLHAMCSIGSVLGNLIRIRRIRVWRIDRIDWVRSWC